MAKGEQYETVERWRIDIVFEELKSAVRTMRRMVPEPWQRGLLDIMLAETEGAVYDLQHKLISAILDAPLPTKVRNMFDSERAICPLCGGTRQDGQGFAVPTGLERHLEGHGDHGCQVLASIVKVRLMEINEENGSRFYMPLGRF